MEVPILEFIENNKKLFSFFYCLKGYLPNKHYVNSEEVKSIQYPIVLQESTYDCAACSLLMIYRYYGGEETLENIKRRMPIKREGTSFLELKEAAKTLKLDAKCYEASLQDLKHIKGPFIAHVSKGEYYHYLVIYKIRKNQLLVADPAAGILVWMNQKRFQKIFLNHVMTFALKTPIQRKGKKSLLIPFFKEHKKSMIMFLLVACISTILESCFTLFFYFFIKINNIHLLFFLFLFSIFFVIIKNKITKVRNHLLLHIEGELEVFLRKMSCLDILKLPYRDLCYQEAGGFAMKLERVNEIVSFSSSLFLFLTIDIPLAVLLFAFAYFLLPHVVVLLFLFLLITIFSYKLVKQKKYLYYQYEEELADVKEKEMFIVTHLKEIHNQNLKEGTTKKLEKRYQHYQSKRNDILGNLNHLLCHQNTWIDITEVCILAFSLMMHLFFALELPELFLFYTLLETIFDVFKNGVYQVSDYTKIKYYLEDFKETKEEIKEIPRIENFTAKNMKLEDFGMLKNISFHFEKKDKILLKGESGLGKSTLAHILCGDYSVDRFYLNGKQNTSLLKEKICYVSNDTMIDNISLEENIKWERKIDEKDFEEILSITHAKEVLEKETVSRSLSSGEKQKISLARALLQDFDVLILDEALNQVDEKEEKKIIESLLSYYTEKMIFVISHRQNLDTLFQKRFLLTKHGQLKRERGNTYL